MKARKTRKVKSQRKDSKKSPAKKTSKSKGEALLVKLLGNVLKGPERSLIEIKLKPRDTANKINEILRKTRNFNHLEVDEMSFAPQDRVCVNWEAEYDSEGNLIGMRCVD